MSEELDAFPEPIAIIMGQVSTKLAKDKENYILKAFQEVGINPNVVVEQIQLIRILKTELTNQKSAILAVVEGLARYDIGQGESVHSGIEIIPHFYGPFLDRDEVLQAIKEVTDVG